MDTPTIRACLINSDDMRLGKRDKSVWVDFPTTSEALDLVYKSLGYDSREAIADISVLEYSTPAKEFTKHLPVKPDFEELNYLAARISELDEYALEKFRAVVAYNENHTIGIKDLINLTYNLDYYVFHPDIHDKYQLFKSKRSAPINYDIEAISTTMVEIEHGKFTGYGYLALSPGLEFKTMYNGSNFPLRYKIPAPEDIYKEPQVTILWSEYSVTASYNKLAV